MRHSTTIAMFVGLVIVGLVGLGAFVWHRSLPGGPAMMLASRSPDAGSPAGRETTAPTAAVSAGPRPEARGTPEPPRADMAPAALRDRKPDREEVPKPQFDIVRVEPTGDALVAGRGRPNATVALVERGKVVAEARTDDGGNFVMMPPALQPGDYALSLRDGSGQGVSESKETVTVSVPRDKAQAVLVAKAEPGRPTQLMSPPPEGKADDGAGQTRPAAGLPATAPPVAIRSVELENGSGFYTTGTAPPGADVRLYLNDARIADVTAGTIGNWSVTVRRGLAAGHYAVRADLVGGNSTVAGRAEVPFDVPPIATPSTPAPSALSRPTPSIPAPARTASASPTPAAPPPVLSASDTKVSRSGDVVVEALQTELVTRGDNLWRISRHRLGQGTRYTQIYAANAAQIRDPAKIYPGQVFVMPRN